MTVAAPLNMTIAMATHAWDAVVIGAGPAGRWPPSNWRRADCARCWSTPSDFRAPRFAAAASIAAAVAALESAGLRHVLMAPSGRQPHTLHWIVGAQHERASLCPKCASSIERGSTSARRRSDAARVRLSRGRAGGVAPANRVTASARVIATQPAGRIRRDRRSRRDLRRRLVALELKRLPEFAFGGRPTLAHRRRRDVAAATLRWPNRRNHDGRRTAGIRRPGACGAGSTQCRGGARSAVARCSDRSASWSPA